MNPCNLTELIPALESAGFRFSKSLGQNFVTAQWVPRTLAEAAEVKSGWSVLEIGPGAGALTRELAARADKVAVIELDERILPVLRSATEEYDNISVAIGDASKTDLALFAEKELPAPRMVCANLPYNITTEILEKLVYCSAFSRITVMIQKEAAQKLFARPGEAAWSLFAARIAQRCDVKKICDVPPGCFTPEPHVVSSIVRLDLLPAPRAASKSEENFQKVLAAAFKLRRKTVVNSIASDLPFSKDTVTERVVAAGLDPRVRGEALTLYEIAALADALYP